MAAGLHQQRQDTRSLPFFLLEMRKRIFVRFYTTDITMATFLGRPPRISKRFCAMELPMDLDEAALSLSGSALEKEIEKMDTDGWNTRGQVHTGTVLRWAVMTSMIREDILELLLSRAKVDVLQLAE